MAEMAEEEEQVRVAKGLMGSECGLCGVWVYEDARQAPSPLRAVLRIKLEGCKQSMPNFWLKVQRKRSEWRKFRNY